ncbi:MAG: hypothetical protein ABEI80_08850 [Haloplanus sp.]
MVEPFTGMESSLLRHVGTTLLVVGVSLLVASTLERTLDLPSRASLLVAALVGVSTLHTWRTSPQYVEAVTLLSAAVAVLLPVAVCLHVFSELLVVQ